ncbi:2-phosphosulfolactate phosphatase [Actinoplanes sp. NPDC051494]|uniref:2-phosphosulfolactate phosphatase n=1 Tax=Actinoplanes sp. NPDC051494 TaxID=3363907 RepID=UPI0037928FFE
MRGTFDWGPAGARSLAPAATVIAVVDVLSFTTALTVAVERGIAVRPYPWRDGTAARFARDNNATLAVGRTQPGPVSLSPATIRTSVGIERLVLPSPNGATISALLAGYDATVIGVSLRNAAAAAAWTRTRLGDGGTVAVIASGERWPDGSLRPAVEDLWGAGSFFHHWVRGGAADLSPEAESALAAYEKVSGNVGEALRACVSGIELRDHGFPQDVDVAAEEGATTAVPVLTDGWYHGS